MTAPGWGRALFELVSRAVASKTCQRLVTDMSSDFFYWGVFVAKYRYLSTQVHTTGTFHMPNGILFVFSIRRHLSSPRRPSVREKCSR